MSIITSEIYNNRGVSSTNSKKLSIITKNGEINY